MNKYKSGSGWHYQSVRHSLARRTGHAGGHYADELRQTLAKKKTKWDIYADELRQTIAKIEEDGQELESYPTDSFEGSNTGDGTLYFYNNNFYEIVKERDGIRTQFGEVHSDTINPKYLKLRKSSAKKSGFMAMFFSTPKKVARKSVVKSKVWSTPKKKLSSLKGISVKHIGVDAGMVMISDAKGYRVRYPQYQKVISVPSGTYNVDWSSNDLWDGKGNGHGTVKITSGKMLVSDPAYAVEQEKWSGWLKKTHDGSHPPKGAMIIDTGGDGVFNFRLGLKRK